MRGLCAYSVSPGPSSGPPTSKSSTSTSTSLSRTRGAAWLSTRPLPGLLGDGIHNDNMVFAHRPRARRTAVSPTSAPTLHRRLERLQSVFHRQLLVSLSDKQAQPWDLKFIRRQSDETLCSYLKRFQTMRNRIPKVTEAT
jgi:hypothetical protein